MVICRPKGKLPRSSKLKVSWYNAQPGPLRYGLSAFLSIAKVLNFDEAITKNIFRKR